jgi:hypothetical protein
MMHPTACDPSVDVQRPSRSRGGYTNVVLTLIAGLLALHIAGGGDRAAVGGPLDVGSAMAQADGEAQMPNAFAQRKEIIAELRQMNGRLERLESRMAQGLSVKVTDMPAMKLPAELRAALMARPAQPGGTTPTPSAPAGPSAVEPSSPRP